jgi:hypothetical protein
MPCLFSKLVLHYNMESCAIASYDPQLVSADSASAASDSSQKWAIVAAHALRSPQAMLNTSMQLYSKVEHQGY